jgi:hypothetical protein
MQKKRGSRNHVCHNLKNLKFRNIIPHQIYNKSTILGLNVFHNILDVKCIKNFVFRNYAKKIKFSNGNFLLPLVNERSLSNTNSRRSLLQKNLNSSVKF